MRSAITLFIFCFSISLCYSQSGTAIYKKEIVFPEDMYGDLKETDPRTYKDFVAFNKKMKEAAKQLEFELQFAKGEAFFEPQEIMSTESIDARMGLGPSDGIYYTNRNTGENLWQTDSYFGKTFIIAKEDAEWELSNETREFAGYRVKKAISKQKVGKGTEEKTRIIEAWYAPDIPVSYGPMGYSGLPGLIVDLTLGRERYYLKDIALNPKEKITIERPSKGEKITFEELQEMARKAMGNFRPD